MGSLSAPQESKKYYYVSLSVTGIATVAYLCMRANIGINYVECAGHQCEGGPYKALQSHGGMSYPLFLDEVCRLVFYDAFLPSRFVHPRQRVPVGDFLRDADERDLHRVRRNRCAEAQRERADLHSGNGHVRRFHPKAAGAARRRSLPDGDEAHDGHLVRLSNHVL